MTLPQNPQAGVCLHLTSLPGPFGIGEIGQAARDFVDAMVAMNLRVWQFLPTGPTAYGDSPYQPLSTFAGNELLIDIDGLVQLGLLKPGEADALRPLPAARVDYGTLIPLKRDLLSLAAGRFRGRASTAVKASCDQFIQDNDPQWLHSYALFRILKTRHGERPWPEWDPAFVHRDSSAVRRIEDAEAALTEQVKILQFLFHHQWQELRSYAAEQAVQLFGDMPIYIALDSADAWADPQLLQISSAGEPRCIAGVPPDYFSADGQLWGNPLYDWPKHAASGYQWWQARLRQATLLADMIRIDHFRGFEACWSVPAGATNARDGHWESAPGDELFHAIQAGMGDLPMVAEDLGLITAAVEALRHRHNLPGMRVLQFEVAAKHFDLNSISANTVCYTGTHDNDTTLGWFLGSAADEVSAEDRHEFQQRVLERTQGRPESIHLDLIRLAFSSDARLAVATLQDYLGLGSEARLNVPGKTGGYWQWRLLPGQLNRQVIDSVGEMTDAADRGRR